MSDTVLTCQLSNGHLLRPNSLFHTQRPFVQNNLTWKKADLQAPRENLYSVENAFQNFCPRKDLKLVELLWNECYVWPLVMVKAYLGTWSILVWKSNSLFENARQARTWQTFTVLHVLRSSRKLITKRILLDRKATTQSIIKSRKHQQALFHIFFSTHSSFLAFSLHWPQCIPQVDLHKYILFFLIPLNPDNGIIDNGLQLAIQGSNKMNVVFILPWRYFCHFFLQKYFFLHFFQ